jgi:hypothetical protein
MEHADGNKVRKEPVAHAEGRGGPIEGGVMNKYSRIYSYL